MAKELNEKNIINVLHAANIADADWELIGAQLIDRRALRTIAANRHGNTSLCMMDTISKWLRTDLHTSWEKLAEAVESVEEYGKATAEAVRRNAGIGTLYSGAARPPRPPSPKGHKIRPSVGGIPSDSKPTIAQLTMLKNSRGEKVEIIKTIAPDWMEVGILMDLDPTGKKVATIEAEHAHKRNGLVTCCRAMFTLWLDQPDATWGNLVKLLIDAEHKELSGQVKDALC